MIIYPHGWLPPVELNRGIDAKYIMDDIPLSTQNVAAQHAIERLGSCLVTKDTDQDLIDAMGAWITTLAAVPEDPRRCILIWHILKSNRRGGTKWGRVLSYIANDKP